jgi:hypothetical protein
VVLVVLLRRGRTFNYFGSSVECLQIGKQLLLFLLELFGLAQESSRPFNQPTSTLRSRHLAGHLAEATTPLTELNTPKGTACPRSKPLRSHATQYKLGSVRGQVAASNRHVWPVLLKSAGDVATFQPLSHYSKELARLTAVATSHFVGSGNCGSEGGKTYRVRRAPACRPGSRPRSPRCRCGPSG